MQETVPDREPVAQAGYEKLFLKVFVGTARQVPETVRGS